MATQDPTSNFGIQVVWGISSSVTMAGTGIAFPIVEQDYHETRQSEQHFEPATGAVIGETFYRKEMTLRLRIYPAGTTGGGAAGAVSANNTPFDPGQILSILDNTPGGPNDAHMNGDWIILDYAKQRRVADKVYFDVSLRRWGGYNP